MKPGDIVRVIWAEPGDVLKNIKTGLIGILLRPKYIVYDRSLNSESDIYAWDILLESTIETIDSYCLTQAFEHLNDEL